METTHESTQRRVSTEAPKQCPECLGSVITNDEETWCRECGLVVAVDRLDRGPETFMGAAGYDRTVRTGAPLTPAMHDRGLSTEIGRGQDGKGNRLSGTKRRRFGRLRREHTRARFDSRAERNLGHAFTEMGRLCGALDLPRSLHKRACVIYREAQSAKLIAGRSIEAVAAGCLYTACREGGWLRTIDEISAISSCDASAIQNAYGVVRAELGIAAQPRRAGDFVPRLASAARVSTPARERAVELAEAATRAGIDNGRNPAGVAAACLYLATHEHGPTKTQVELAEHAGMTPVTIRSRTRELQALGA